MKLPELLAPAGNLEKLKMAIHYGADAVYLSGKHYGLRTYAGNFTLSEMAEAMKLARKQQVKVYVTLNIIARNSDMNDLPDYLTSLSDLAVDGLIVSDPGIIAHARQVVPHIPLHVSTQLSTSNWSSASFWEQQGITRVNLARELSLEEIALIKQKVSLELEIFVHGSLCISHSGRCLLSTYLAQRDSNRGACAHPCRWKYALMEENRPGVYFPISEDEQGSYIFNAKDLCLLEYLPEIIATGVDALKIEGRMKGINYVAGVTRIYRHALKCYSKDPENYQFQQQWLFFNDTATTEIYTTGFVLGAPSGESYNYATSEYIRTHTLVGVVREILPFRGKSVSPDAGNQVRIQVRNKIVSGDEIEFITKELESYHMKLGDFTNEKGEMLQVAQPGQEILLRTDLPVRPNDLIRKKKS
jgi:putative protease